MVIIITCSKDWFITTVGNKILSILQSSTVSNMGYNICGGSIDECENARGRKLGPGSVLKHRNGVKDIPSARYSGSFIQAQFSLDVT